MTLTMVVSVTAGVTAATEITAQAAAQDIVVLYTNDVHCGVDDNIGYAGLALYKKEMQAQTPYVTLVDAGDAIQGAPIGTLSDGDGGYIVDIMNYVGYDFAIPGNHEFDYGMPRFLELAGKMKCGYYSCNFMNLATVDIMNYVGYDFAIPGNHEFDYGMPRFLELAGKMKCGYYSCNFMNLATGTPVLAPYKMFTYGDTQVAFVGVSTPESFTKSTPTYFQDANGNYLFGFCEGENGQALYNQVQVTVDAAIAQGADYVIMVGHLGNIGVSSQWSSEALIKNTTGIDAVQVQVTVDAAIAQGADYVIMVGHLGNIGVSSQWSSEALIKNTTGIDAVIDGHSHETYDKTYPNKNGEQVVVTQTGTKLSNIGKMTIKPDGTITTEMVTAVPDAGFTTYTVQKNDSLSKIAKKTLGSTQAWPIIYNANRDKIRKPNIITAGTVLTIPGGAAATEDGKFVDASTDAYIKQIQAQYSESLKTVLGNTSVALTVNDLATGQRAVRSAETNLGDLCADAYRYQLEADIGFMNGGGVRDSIAAGTMATGQRAVRSAETNLGDLCADAYRYQLEADIGFMNGGGVRDSIAAGTITYNDTLKVFPFGNMGCVIEATGQQIKDALEMASKDCPTENGGFMQVSGLTYTIDTSIPSSVKEDEKGNFQGVSGAYRVSDIKVGEEPLDLNKTYTVASHNYMLKSGGDGMVMFNGCKVVKDDVMVDVDILSTYILDLNKTYTVASHNYMLKSGGDGMVMFNGCKVVKDDVMVDVDILSTYISEKLGGTVGAEYANPAGQGRITIK